MRSVFLVALTLSLGGCGFLDQILASGSTSYSRKVYLNPMDVVTVGLHEDHDFACVDRPLLCVSRGVGFECRCP